MFIFVLNIKPNELILWFVCWLSYSVYWYTLALCQNTEEFETYYWMTEIYNLEFDIDKTGFQIFLSGSQLITRMVTLRTTCLKIHYLCIWSRQCIYVFCVIIRINIDICLNSINQLIEVTETCFLWCTNWIIKHFYEFRDRNLKSM